jgi:hypothetical protein
MQAFYLSLHSKQQQQSEAKSEPLQSGAEYAAGW